MVSDFNHGFIKSEKQRIGQSTRHNGHFTTMRILYNLLSLTWGKIFLKPTEIL